MKAFIINFNRVTIPEKMANWLALRGCEPVFIDNNSDYEPLLQYYLDTPYKVVSLRGNYGHTVMWLPELQLLDRLAGNERYIVTDPDLDLSGVPDDFLTILNKGLDKYKVDKCGLSLEIEDLPDTENGNFIRNKCEAKYWKQSLDNMYFRADTDTTFALYRGGVRNYSHSAIRTNRPYTAKHLPWYYENLKDLPADEQYYFKTANDSSSGKKRLL